LPKQLIIHVVTFSSLYNVKIKLLLVFNLK
jgi:hypothetical protein